MRKMMYLALVGVIVAAGVSSGGPDRVGTLVEVPVKGGPKEVEARVGDLIQFELGYAVVPDQIVSDLKLGFAGEELARLGTVRVPKRSPDGHQVMGSMAIAAFVRVDRVGQVTVKVTPRIAATGKDGEPVTVKVTVRER